MSVVTFVRNREEESGKTMSLVAIATHMSIEYNKRILIISTTDKKDKIRTCFFEKKEAKKMKLGIFGDNKSILDSENGIEGIAKISRSNKLTPNMITNYTKIVFKDRLEIILGTERREREKNNQNENMDLVEEKKEIQEEYVDLINAAGEFYDMVLVDLDNNIRPEVRKKIIQISNLVIINTSQNLESIEELQKKKQNDELLQSPKTLLLIGRYDKFSKVNIKNVTRMLGEKNKVLTIPYNTLFFEAANEQYVADLFLRLRKVDDSDDRNAIFVQEVKRATENIIYRLQELQARM